MSSNTIPIHSRALDALEASINSILLQTGTAFCDPSNYDSWKIARTSTQLKHTLPPALSTFHDALDELERELIRARAVLQRDFNNAQLRQSFIATQNGVKSSDTITNSPDIDTLMSDAPRQPAGLDSDNDEQVLLEQSAQPIDTGDTKQVRETSPHKLKHGQETSDSQKPAEQSPESLMDTMNLETAKNDEALVETGESKNTAEDIAKPQTFVNSSSNGDTAPPSATNEYHTYDDIFGSTPHTANMTPNDASLSNVDVSSLLPGLEFYANEDNAGTNDALDDFVNLSNTGANDFLLNDGNNGAQSLSEMPVEDMMGGNFDDLFANFGGDSNNTGALGQGTGTVEDDTFDASFFNLDD